MIQAALRDIYRVNLGVKKTERVLVFTDRPSKKETVPPDEMPRRQRLRDIALLASEAGRGLAKEVLFLEYPATGSHGVEPPQGLWELAFGKKAVLRLKELGLLHKILKKTVDDAGIKGAEEIIGRFKKNSVDAVIALSNYSTSHTRFRDFLTRLSGARYASMPIFDVEMLGTAMKANEKALEKRTRALQKIVNRAEAVEINAPNGTRIGFSKKGRRAHSDTGALRRPGSFGNLPAGEVFFAPLEGTAKGRLVLEWAPTRRLESPITLIVKDGVVREVLGEEPYASHIRAKLAERPENANIAELGIGTNDMAKRPENILESEKILGTVHIALGDNSSFGGTVKTPFHQDFVFFRPTVRLTGKDGSKTIIMRNGKLLVEV